MDRGSYENRRSTLTSIEAKLSAKLQHVSSYEESRANLAMDGTPLSWERWRAEQQLLTSVRAEAQRFESVLRIELELLEYEVALAQHRRARAVAGGKEALA